MTDREELRRRLREKIRGKRGAAPQPPQEVLAEQLRADPASAMLALGIDDADILRNAGAIVRSARRQASQPTSRRPAETPGEASDEEAPPP